MDFNQFIDSLNITHEQARSWCGKTPRQWRRYRAGDSPFPQYLKQLVLLQAGYLGAISPDWIGWQIQGDILISPEGLTYSATWFRSLPWYLERLRAERARLRQRIRELEQADPPVPENVIPFPGVFNGKRSIS